MIKSEKNHTIIKWSLITITICCILAYLTIFAILNVYGFERYCNADTYADTLVAKKMWEQKTLFPQDWIFGNQYYVIATPVLAALLYGIIGNINTAMVFATEIMTLLTLLSFFWMLRAITKDLLSSLVCCLLLVASIVALAGPYSLWPQFFFLQASYYACYLITMFIVFGDYIRAFQSPKPRLATWGLSLLLCYATGMQSLRQTVIMVLPILAYELFLAFRRILYHEKAWSRENNGSIIRGLSYGVANLAGVITTKLMPIATESIYGEMQPISLKTIAQRLPPVWSAICEATNLDYILNFNGFSRMFVLYILFLLTIFLVSAILWFARIKRPETALEICWLLCLVGIFGVLLSTVLFNITLRSVYIFMWFPLVALSGLMILKKLSVRHRHIATLLICALTFIHLCYGYLPETKNLFVAEPRDSELMCQWAMENGYEYVYGDYWSTAPYIAVYSEGKIEAGCWYPTECIYQPQGACNSQDIYGVEENKKAIYVFSAADEDYGLLVAKERGVSLTKVAEFGDLRAYTSPVPLMQNS